MDDDLLHEIHRAAEERVIFVPHEIRQMSRPERMIAPDEVEFVIRNGEIIEDYPNDERGHSVLMAGESLERRTIHVVCAAKQDHLVIITAYLPYSWEWSEDFKTRKKK